MREALTALAILVMCLVFGNLGELREWVMRFVEGMRDDELSGDGER